MVLFPAVWDDKERLTGIRFCCHQGCCHSARKHWKQREVSLSSKEILVEARVWEWRSRGQWAREGDMQPYVWPRAIVGPLRLNSPQFPQVTKWLWLGIQTSPYVSKGTDCGLMDSNSSYKLLTVIRSYKLDPGFCMWKVRIIIPTLVSSCENCRIFNLKSYPKSHALCRVQEDSWKILLRCEWVLTEFL